MRRCTSVAFHCLAAGFFFVPGLCFAAGARGQLLLQEQVTPLDLPSHGPFVRAGDGAIWGGDPGGLIVSRDDGKSWEPKIRFEPERFLASGERALLRTREGVILYAFLNRKELNLNWNDELGGPQADCRVPVYVVRSADDGKTWAAPVLRQDGWCGAVRQMIQLRSGRVLLVSQKAVANPGRHVTLLHYSDDLGKSWQTSEVIDLGEYGGYGDHGGGIEGTVLEKADGTLKLLLRTPQGCFQETASSDGGATWRTSFPSTIAASTAPGVMIRLASGRVALIWNRYRDPAKKLGGRDELSLAFSDNDGLTWTPPQVFARATPGQGRQRIAYPYIFEAAPGRLWVTTMYGGLRATLNEADFLTPVAQPLDGPALSIITLGDSVTRGARQGVKPTETFSALLQDALNGHGVRAQVHNIGIGGERTDQALRRLEHEVLSQRPDLVTVMYGINDSWVDKGRAASRLSESDYAANLSTLVRRLQAADIRIVLMTPQRFAPDHRRNGLGEDPNIRLARYVALARKVARETGVVLVDYFADWDAAHRAGRDLWTWTTDGCHPNVAGHADLAQRLTTAVLPLARNVSLQR